MRTEYRIHMGDYTLRTGDTVVAEQHATAGRRVTACTTTDQ